MTVSGYLGGSDGVYAHDPFRITIHEFAHYLLGGNEMHNGYGFWGMLCDWGTRSYVANSFEKYQLGWINSPTTYTINANTTTNSTLTGQTLDDFVTNGHAYRITVDASTNEYFYLENHQNSNYWETHSPFSSHPNSVDGNIESGLYVIRQIGMINTSDPNNYGKWIKFAKELIPADGRYTWSVVSSYNQNGKILPIWFKGAPNITTGYNDLELVSHNYNYNGIENPAAISYIRDTLTHNNIYPAYYLGDGKDAFRIGYNHVFSPWSNPNNQRSSDNATRFGFELTSISNGVCTLNFYVNTSAEASPSKPQNLSFSGSTPGNPVNLSWDANTESDMSLYEVSRKVTIDDIPSSWSVLGTTTNNYYVDSGYLYATSSPFQLHYRIRAKDTQNKYSVYSDEVDHGGYPMGKISVASNNKDTSFENEDNNESLVNYPNPFNPTTKISYSIPEAVFVTLKVYDILGREIVTLVNEARPSGKYEVDFNASQLPSGTYVYRLAAGKQLLTRKMILIK